MKCPLLLSSPGTLLIWHSPHNPFTVSTFTPQGFGDVIFLLCITWSLFPHLGVEAPFGSFSSSLTFRTMIWIVRCSLRTYLSYPLSSSTLHAIPELLQDEKDFILPELARRREGLYLVPQLAQGVHLPPWMHWGLFLAWTRSTARRTLSGASTCPGCTSPPPLDALRTFSLASKCARALMAFCTTGTSDRQRTMRSLKL